MKRMQNFQLRVFSRVCINLNRKGHTKRGNCFESEIVKKK